MSKNQMLQNNSFRDPSGYVFIQNNNVRRILKRDEGRKYLNLWSESPIIENWIKKKQLIPYSVAEENNSEIILDHPKIDFISYPFEWSASMLYDAAELTITLASALISEKKGLKDANAYNILYQGPKPIFIDLTSIEIRDQQNPYWLAFAQFIRMFVLPLYLSRFYNIDVSSLLLSHFDGPSYSNCKKIVRRYLPFEISLIHLPHFLSKYKTDKIYKNHAVKNPELAFFILRRILKKAEKQLKKVKPTLTKQSNWSTYLKQMNHYSTAEFQRKCLWVDQTIAKIKPKKVLDIGCNTGHFSVIAAKQNAQVVSIDYDETVIDKLFNYAKSEALNIQPMVVNIARPTPGLGWKNTECFSFLQRANNHFELVMMLALIHHLLITDRIPMEEIAELAYAITNNYLIIEFIDKQDVMFTRLTKGREALYSHINLEFFKKTFLEYFEFIEETDNTYHPTRKLLLAKKRS